MRRTIAILLLFLLLLSLAACGWKGCGAETTEPETEAATAETEDVVYPPAPDGVTDPTAETIILPMDKIA